MGKWFVVGAALLLAGCVESSPFLGQWESPTTGAKYRISEDGKCRYTNNEGLGQHCEWEPLEDTKMIVRIGEGRFFVEAETMLVGDEMMTFWPNGVDSFRPVK